MKMKHLILIVGSSCFLSHSVMANENISNDLTEWLSQRVLTAEAYLNNNISPKLPGYKPGFVMAAPWAVPGIQNYRYHWVRDAALVMNTIVSRYITAREGSAEQKQYLNQISDYINFSKQNQLASEPADAEKVSLGEVKFNPDGSRFTKWMRPQNDGPALRAITLLGFSRQLLSEGKIELVRHLYDGSGSASGDINASGIIKADLDYISSHWKDMSFDPWEEVKGHHFYTRLVQRKALLDGSRIAEILGDTQDARNFQAVAKDLELVIRDHWLPKGKLTPSGRLSSGQIWDSFDRVYGVDYKTTGLDVAIVLGALHAHNEFDKKGDHFFSASDDRILKTAFDLARAFQEEFPLAHQDLGKFNLGVPIGRYPEDKYNGYDSKNKGNPWYLTTAAFAELYYRCAKEWLKDGKIPVTANNLEFLSSLISEHLKVNEIISPDDHRFDQLVASIRLLGDSYLNRVKFHEGVKGHFSEEFSRDDGSPQGAEDLSWSYASILTAAEQRNSEAK